MRQSVGRRGGCLEHIEDEVRALVAHLNLFVRCFHEPPRRSMPISGLRRPTISARAQTAASEKIQRRGRMPAGEAVFSFRKVCASGFSGRSLEKLEKVLGQLAEA